MSVSGMYGEEENSARLVLSAETPTDSLSGPNHPQGIGGRAGLGELWSRLPYICL